MLCYRLLDFKTAGYVFCKARAGALKRNRRFWQCASPTSDLRNKLAHQDKLLPSLALRIHTRSRLFRPHSPLLSPIWWIGAKLQTVLQSIVSWVNLLTIQVEVLYLRGCPWDRHTRASCGKRCCNFQKPCFYLRSLLHFRYYLLEYLKCSFGLIWSLFHC